MRGFLGSLVVRISGAFLLGLFLLQLVVAALVIWPDGRPTIFRLVSPQQAGAIARAMEAASSEQRPALIEALNGGALVVHLQATFAGHEGRIQNDRSLYFRKLYAGYASAL